MAKRKSSHKMEAASASAPAESRRRSVRLQKSENENDGAQNASKASTKSIDASTREAVEKPKSAVKNRVSKSEVKAEDDRSNTNDEPPAKRARSEKPQTKGKAAGQKTSSVNKIVPKKEDVWPSTSGDQEKTYWLLKAEPESRFENGIDVKFSIDDLAARTEPEPWDGIRNYAARNNLRAMKKGDLAFFYHSNCKEPGIVGIMEIVKEHSPDLSAHDPKAPYYDPKSTPDDPKWSVVHVKFHRKFKVPIGLKELKEMGGAGKPLENMQMIRQSRLSVSKVSQREWDYLVGLAEEKASKA
ncbi:PUA-like domain-containing protein [Podospora fimiseda]|uniref:Thymocyte nuclear protein 1 n=1 Tax=Podospora fimiseda TaxID=252190 RepID=A0AAN7GXD4_9PEZI|nr:PUA-like domain-containing protein [Podospora fimiseda]